MVTLFIRLLGLLGLQPKISEKESKLLRKKIESEFCEHIGLHSRRRQEAKKEVQRLLGDTPEDKKMQTEIEQLKEHIRHLRVQLKCANAELKQWRSGRNPIKEQETADAREEVIQRYMTAWDKRQPCGAEHSPGWSEKYARARAEAERQATEQIGPCPYQEAETEPETTPNPSKPKKTKPKTELEPI